MFPDDYTLLDPQEDDCTRFAPDWIEDALLAGKLSVRRHVHPFPGMKNVLTTRWALVCVMPDNVDVIMTFCSDKAKIDKGYNDALRMQRLLRRDKKKADEEERENERMRAKIKAYVDSLSPEERERWEAESARQREAFRQEVMEKYNIDIGVDASGRWVWPKNEKK